MLLVISLSALGPSWGSQGRVISRSSDKFRGEPSSARPSPQPVFPYSGKVWSCEQEASGGSAPWDGTRCFFCMALSCPFPKPSWTSAQACPRCSPHHARRSVVLRHLTVSECFLGSAELLDEREPQR